MLNVVLFGPPGAGKGTQAAYLKQHFHLIHLSTGDLLRSQIAASTKLGVEAKLFIDRGELVPDEVVIGMIKSALETNADAKGFIFDGFPRTVEQAIALDKLLNTKDAPVAGMLALQVDKQELINRLLERGKTSGRSDDRDVSIVENRINVYHEKTSILIDYYKSQGKFYSVEGIGTIVEIADRLEKVVDSLKYSII